VPHHKPGDTVSDGYGPHGQKQTRTVYPDYQNPDGDPNKADWGVLLFSSPSSQAWC
jgi:hypothetical protein